MSGIMVDIGTGDGKFTYELAAKNPTRLMIGIDPNHEGMVKMSSKTGKKLSRGGLSNALFILADVANLPKELNGLANQVFIIMPWGSLLAGIVNLDKKVWSSIHRICQKGAIVDMVLGFDEDIEKTEIAKYNLPAVFNLTYIDRTMKPILQKMGFAHMQVNSLDADRLRQVPSSWAKKLSFGGNRKFFQIRLKVI